MDLFFISYEGKQVEVSLAPDGKPDTYIVHFPGGDKVITKYELQGKTGWRYVNEELSTEAQKVGDLIAEAFIIRVSDSDFKTADEYFKNKKPRKDA